MPKVLVGANSAALNADIIALFEEEDLDPIKEMIEMVKQGHKVVNPDTNEEVYIPLDPDQRFKVLKELSGYVAPKIKAVDVSEKRKQKTVIKIVKHGETALIANGSNVLQVEGPLSADEVAAAAEQATKVPEVVRAAARLDAYGGAELVRSEASGVTVESPVIKVKDVTDGN